MTMPTRPLPTTDSASSYPNQRPEGPKSFALAVEPWNQLYQYWVEKHVDGHPPSRKDIDPMIDIPKLAANLMILDIMPDGYDYRLVGSTVVDRIGHDITGKPFGTSGFDPAAISEFRAALDLVVDEVRPHQLVARIDHDPTALNNLILLPLVSAGNQVEKILVGSFYNEHFKPGTRISGLSTKEIEL
jgi:hypothetical protein